MKDPHGAMVSCGARLWAWNLCRGTIQGPCFPPPSAPPHLLPPPASPTQRQATVQQSLEEGRGSGGAGWSAHRPMGFSSWQDPPRRGSAPWKVLLPHFKENPYCDAIQPRKTSTKGVLWFPLSAPRFCRAGGGGGACLHGVPDLAPPPGGMHLCGAVRWGGKGAVAEGDLHSPSWADSRPGAGRPCRHVLGRGREAQATLQHRWLSTVHFLRPLA